MRITTGPSALLTVALTLGLSFLASFSCSTEEAATGEIEYPLSQMGDVVDTLHGVEVADPYRWLEDHESAETVAWVEAQNELTFGYLGEIPEREWIKNRLTEMWNYERSGIPRHRGGRYIVSRNDGLQDQSVLYTMRTLDGKQSVLLDPNLFSEDGTASLYGYELSEDGRYLAYGVSISGSDWSEWYVRDIETGENLPDTLRWVKFSDVSWTHDNKGFYYSRYDEPTEEEALSGSNYFQKLYYHRLSTPQSEDLLIYERPDKKEWGFFGSVTDDGRYLVIYVWIGSEHKNGIFYLDLAKPAGTVVELLSDFDAEYDYLGNDGPLFWFETDLDAPRSRVIAIDIRNPSAEHWKEIIPEQEEPLRSVGVVGDRFTTRYLKDAYTIVRLFKLEGTPDGEITLPGLGSAYGFGGRLDDRETFYIFSSFTTPSTVYRYDFDDRTSSIFHRPPIDLNSDEYETKQVFHESKDGTRVPMFITHRKGIELDGNNPTYLFGYGGFGSSMSPYFSVSMTVWMEMGGVFAVSNARGGGEYGKEWHDAGKKLNKQNTFDDFIAAAEWLIDNGYTSAEKLAIGGGSNGGLLVGVCMLQRPDLFGAVLPGNGVLDMLRFHKFTIGWAWISDYGSPEDPDEFEVLYGYSPVHNVRENTAYPATLITTADHDDRVVPAHSYKFTAALQRAQTSPAPILVRVETKAGHGAGIPMKKLIEEKADTWAFLVHVLDVEIPESN